MSHATFAVYDRKGLVVVHDMETAVQRAIAVTGNPTSIEQEGDTVFVTGPKGTTKIITEVK